MKISNASFRLFIVSAVLAASVCTAPAVYAYDTNKYSTVQRYIREGDSQAREAQRCRREADAAKREADRYASEAERFRRSRDIRRSEEKQKYSKRYFERFREYTLKADLADTKAAEAYRRAAIYIEKR